MVAAIPFDLLIYRSGDEVVRGGGEGEVGKWEGNGYVINKKEEWNWNNLDKRQRRPKF